MTHKVAFYLAVAALLSGCSATLSGGVPGQIETVAGAPSAICTSLLQQNARDLAALKAVLAAP